ncbi:hypothetical protein AL755_08410 [Arthrobacter sp. ERGS1:01]|nr:hypothetical protein AL755_08410 [Arthrobacter sp. ERGS1:01]
MDGALAYDRSHGILRTSNLQALGEFAQVAPSVLLASGGFEEAEYTYLPWPAMQTIAVAKCRSSPAVVLDMVERDANAWGEMAAGFGYYRPFGNRQTIDLEQPFPEYETQKLAWDVVRNWCGETALDQWSELARVRGDNARLMEILERALAQLENTDKKYHAARLRGEVRRTVGRTS